MFEPNLTEAEKELMIRFLNQAKHLYLPEMFALLRRCEDHGKVSADDPRLGGDRRCATCLRQLRSGRLLVGSEVLTLGVNGDVIEMRCEKARKPSDGHYLLCGHCYIYLRPDVGRN